MPRATVRAAITAYLQSGIAAGAIPSLSKVFGHPPALTPEGDFYANQGPGFASGAAIYLHLITHDERRIAIGGATSGRKSRPYHVGLICVLRSTKPDTQIVGADNDLFLDGVTGWIQANRTAGVQEGSTFFQWGEGDEGPGSIDLVVKAGMPKKIRGQSSQVFSTIDVTALEILIT